MEISKLIAEHAAEVIELRRDFHRHPELGFEEFRTADIIEKYLTALGIATQRIAKTGVVGISRGARPEPVLMLRSDMDALPIEEENDVDYKSQNNGVMHACGHTRTGLKMNPSRRKDSSVSWSRFAKPTVVPATSISSMRTFP